MTDMRCLILGLISERVGFRMKNKHDCLKLGVGILLGDLVVKTILICLFVY